jgi:hypothetical protein
MLEKGYLDATKIGSDRAPKRATWVSTARKLLKSLGIEAS